MMAFLSYLLFETDGREAETDEKMTSIPLHSTGVGSRHQWTFILKFSPKDVDC